MSCGIIHLSHTQQMLQGRAKYGNRNCREIAFHPGKSTICSNVSCIILNGTFVVFLFCLIDSEHVNKSGVTKTLELLSKPKVLFPMVLRMIGFLPVMVIHSMGSVITMEYFKLAPRENGLFFAAIGLASAVCLV